MVPYCTNEPCCFLENVVEMPSLPLMVAIAYHGPLN
jgi:hypothetical protein